MKNAVLAIVLVLGLSFSYGQNKSVEKMTELNTKEMVKVLSLITDQEASIYKINLDKNTKLEANRTNSSLTKDEKIINRKSIYKEAQQAFRAVLGKEKVKEWNVYKNAQSEARKKNKQN